MEATWKPADLAHAPQAERRAADGSGSGANAGADFNRLVYCLMGLPVDAISRKQAVRSLQSAARRHTRCFLSTPNLNFLIASRTDASFRDSVIRSDLSVADGMPLVWMARVLGMPLRERVAGATLFEQIAAGEETDTMRVYFFGGPVGAAARASDRVNAVPTGMHCVGYASPGYGTVEEMSDDQTIRSINQLRPDFLVVALGAKKGQRWIEHNLAELSVPIVSHLGAVINMAAGTISRAPRWMQRSGMEWLWRIKEEPALWRRYLGDALALGSVIVGHLLPSLFYERIYRHSVTDWSASVRLEHSHGSCKIVLQGAWDDSTLRPLRTALAQATAQPCDMLVDMRAVRYGDSAFIALLIILYGHQSRTGRQLRLMDVAPVMQRILRAHGAAYLMEPTV